MLSPVEVYVENTPQLVDKVLDLFLPPTAGPFPEHFQSLAWLAFRYRDAMAYAQERPDLEQARVAEVAARLEFAKAYRDRDAMVEEWHAADRKPEMQ